jgi:hypothetical protein
MADDHSDLTTAFLAYCDTQLALERAEEAYAEAEKETVRPLIQARTANKEARTRLAEMMQGYGISRFVL